MPNDIETILVPADKPEETTEPTKASSKVFTEEEVEKIRKQEKDKLYNRLEESQNRLKTMEEQLALLTKEREDAVKSAEEKARAEAEAIRQRELEELSAKELLARKEDEFNKRINSVEEEWAQKFAQLDAEREAQKALLEKERELQAIEAYRQRRINEEQETIIPELIDLIAGNSQDEIEDSISVLRARSNAIIESIQQANPQGRLKGAPVTAPPIGPMDDNTDYQTLTAEDIRNMPMDQYAKMRERLHKARPARGRF